MTHTFRASARRVGHACQILYTGEMLPAVKSRCREVAELANTPYDPSFPDIIRAEIDKALATRVAPVTGVMAGVACSARVLGYAGDTFTDAAALSDAGADAFHHMRDVNAFVRLN